MAIIVANVPHTAVPTRAKKAARFHRAGQVRVVVGSSTRDSGNRERIGPMGTRRVPSASWTATGPISQPDIVRPPNMITGEPGGRLAAAGCHITRYLVTGSWSVGPRH
ncbi:hypothetical protein [Pseudofrankia sp. BMG5.36]|uniref:hypothetical protein n=1 Tax=Pseudofrankia sp. BMG5.36 TaxID=1834512 RepID=UPI0008D98465|nr:hypothetical protein [Pseudofrankia sp. BMG5.36]OHV58094.1 hypothetical protein BCD48_06390 [Pseudofrankia sp. BMG5.36]